MGGSDLWAVAAVLLARAIVVYGLGWLANRVAEPLPLRWQHVLNWGGLRGAISLALALSLPAALAEGRDLLQLLALGVVLFTLLVQATTMSTLLRRLGLTRRDEAEAEYEVRRGRLMAIYAAGRHLERAYQEGLLSEPAWRVLEPEVTARAVKAGKGLAQLLEASPGLQASELDAARRELLRAERSAMVGLRRSGLIAAGTADRLLAEVDAALEKAGPPPGDGEGEDATGAA